MRHRFLPYYQPDISQAEIDAVVESMTNGWLTTGPRARDFESAFVELSGVKHAIALNSCTAALHIALLGAGVGPGDEVVTPSLTFVAGAQCALEVGATPVFCDVDSRTLSVTLESIEAVVTERTKAIIVMPYGGRPFDVREIVAYAHKRGIAVIEDAAHATGMLERGTWAGTHSDAAAYSFYATKNITSGEGGVLLTNSDTLADRARTLSLHGMNRDAWKRYTQGGSWRYDVREPGFKYNMPDVLASMGLVQLRRLESMQARRSEIARRYLSELSSVPGISFQAPPSNSGDRHSYCMFVIRVDAGRAGIHRDDLIERLKASNIGTSVHYIPTHLFSGYQKLARTPLPVTERVWAEILSLPLYPTMTESDIADVVEAVRVNVPSQNVRVGSST